MRASLTKLARPSGALAMVAVDQREALRGMFTAHQSTPVPDSQLTQFKVDVARELSPYASALLVDQEFGIDAIIDQKALQGSCGLIAAADLLVGPAGGAATDTAVDPDVDRLAFVCEDGSMFGEEYTLVAIADYVLAKTPGATVSNLSSTRALRDITEAKGQLYAAAAVGEVNVVAKMKEIKAVIGGEGNGGVIYPDLHYGRDSLVGIALFLSHLAENKRPLTDFRDQFPAYSISKNKIDLSPTTDVDAILLAMANKYSHEEVDTTDGVKIYIGKEWVHLRKSNTEPIIRIYAESKDSALADQLALRIVSEIQALTH